MSSPLPENTVNDLLSVPSTASSAEESLQASSITPLSLPPEACFASFEELKLAAEAHALAAGYAFVTGKGDTKNGRKIRHLDCKRAGNYRGKGAPKPEHRARDRKSVKSGCQFSIKARERVNGSWDLTYRSDPKYCQHNHPPADRGTFAADRQLSDAQNQTVITNFQAGVAARQTAATLRQEDPNLRITHRDLYNITAKIRRASEQGHSPSEGLILELERAQAVGEVFFEHLQDEQGHLSKLFIADARSIKYLNENPDILLFDCTYKTNKFGMPLLDIIGIDGRNRTFTVGVAFLDSETESDYDWAVGVVRQLLNDDLFPAVIATDCEPALIHALDKTFPSTQTKTVLCFWHVSKNVTVNCKGRFGTAERFEEFLNRFKEVVYAKTEEQFQKLLGEWETDFHWNNGNQYSISQHATIQEREEIGDWNLERDAVAYCLGQWLIPYRDKIVHAWVDRHFHGGVTSTSRLEGAHSVLKRWINSSCKDLGRVWDSIKLAVDDQFNEINIGMAQETSSTPIRVQGQDFSGVVGKITHHGLSLLWKQWNYWKHEDQYREQGKPVDDICTGTYYSSMGVPCWHMIKSRIAAGEPIQPRDFHPHYHYDRTSLDEPVIFRAPILDPVSRQRRNTEETERRAHQRQHQRLRRAQTGRILSGFEQRETAIAHCSACTDPGHDKAVCRGCRSTGHKRNNCPFRPFEMGNVGPQLQTPSQIQPNVPQTWAQIQLPPSSQWLPVNAQFPPPVLPPPSPSTSGTWPPTMPAPQIYFPGPMDPRSTQGQGANYLPPPTWQRYE